MKRKLTKLLCLLLTVCLLLSSVPAAAAAGPRRVSAERSAPDGITSRDADRITVPMPSKADKFRDLDKTAWYYPAVCYVTDKGFFSGVSERRFDPGGTMTRAMAVTVLGRMAGVRASLYRRPSAFTDVVEGIWYAPYVEWASGTGIVSGTGDGKFSPDRPITRQELVCFFVRYCEVFGVSPGDDLLRSEQPADMENVADWAEDSVLTMWYRGLMQGTGKGCFEPEKEISRAECAQICMSMDKTVDRWRALPNAESWNPVTPGGNGSYTVTFLDTDGTELAVSTVKIGLGLADAELPYRADPDPERGVRFIGWVYTDADGRERMYNNLYAYNRNMTVRALCAAESDIPDCDGDESYIIEGAVPADYAVLVRPKEPGAVLELPRDAAVYARDDDRPVSCSATPLANGDYLIFADGYNPGATYIMALSDKFNYVVETETGEGDVAQAELIDEVRYLQYQIDMPVSGELLFREDIFWVPESEFASYPSFSADGLHIERELDDTGTKLGTGGFTCPADTGYYPGAYLCVYSDAVVEVLCEDGTVTAVRREAPNTRSYAETDYTGRGYTYADVYAGEECSYLALTGVTPAENNTVSCSFRELGAEELGEIYYVPDVIPFRVETLPRGASGRVENYAAYDCNMYFSYSGGQTPGPRVGDFVVFYTDSIDDYSEEDFERMREGGFDGELPYVYGRITAVNGKALTYTVADRYEVTGALEYFEKCNFQRYIPESMVPPPSAEQLELLEQEAEQLLDEEALRAFVFSSVEADAEDGNSEAQQALQILEEEGGALSFAAPVRGNGHAPDDTKRVEITGSNVSADFTKAAKYLKKSDGRWHFTLDVGLMLIIKLRLNDDQNMYYVVSANFTQELCLGITAGGSFGVSWALCVPVPTEITFFVGGVAETATDITLDIRRYIVDDTVYDVLYGKYKNAQEIWNQFQEFLLCDEFVNHGAGLYARESAYDTLVAEADAVPPENIEEKTKAEQAVTDAAIKINRYWDEKEKGLNAAFLKYFANEVSTETANFAEKETAKLAVAAAGDKLKEEVLKLPGDFDIMSGLLEDTEKKVSDAIEEGKELLGEVRDEPVGFINDRDEDSVDEAEQQLENARDAVNELRAGNNAAAQKQEKKANPDIVTYLESAELFLKKTEKYLNAATAAMDTLLIGADETYASARRLREMADSLREIANWVSTARRLVNVMIDLSNAIMRLVNLLDSLKGDGDGTITKSDVVFSMIKSLHATSKDVYFLLGNILKNYMEEGSEAYESLHSFTAKLGKANDFIGGMLTLYSQYMPLLLDADGNFMDGSNKNGDRTVPKNSKYWVFRYYRTGTMREFSLNTEIVERLNSPDEGLNDDNIKVLADKYQEMLSVTNSWMDLYRRQIGDDLVIPVCAGVDAVITLEFVFQANINAAVNFNFHVEYGKEFRIRVNLLDRDVSTDVLDRANQKLTVRAVAMGTLGIRAGFEVGLALQVAAIFRARATFELMPYASVYGYLIFEYEQNLLTKESSTKRKGAIYFDTGFHLGIVLSLSVDVIAYTNTWKFRVLTRDFPFFDIGDRKNVYNFGYSQPTRSDFTAFEEQVDTALNIFAPGDVKEAVNTGIDGLLFVSPATDYQLPAAARMMSYMDMTTGELGKAAFDASRFDYTFFRAPAAGGSAGDNLPVVYKTVTVNKKDADGNIIYQENGGKGVPVEINVDADVSAQYDEPWVLVTNKGTPVTETVVTDETTIDVAGIEAGAYVEDTRFSVDENGRIRCDDSAGLVSEEVYVYITWKEGALEFSNYPLRRVLHVIWTNVAPLSWIDASVTVEDESGAQSVVWNKTVLSGWTQVRIPGITYILDTCDPDRLIYSEEYTHFAGAYSDRGTTVSRPQESFTAYVQAERKTHLLELRGLNADGTPRTEYCPAKFGETFPVPETFTRYVTVTDESGGVRYLTFEGFVPVMEKNGVRESWIFDWTRPLNGVTAGQLSSETEQYYLDAVYRDDTVTATFCFAGADRENLVQQLRRGTAPDEGAVTEILQQLQNEALARGETMSVTWNRLPGVLDTDATFVLDCRTVIIAAPTVTEGAEPCTVRLRCDAETGANDVVTFGFVPLIPDEVSVKWLAPGTDTVPVEPGIEYLFYTCVTDGETLKRYYSAPASYTLGGAREDAGYETALDVFSAGGNPAGTVKLTLRLKYTTGVYSDPVTLTLAPGETVRALMPSPVSPDMITALAVTAADEEGGALSGRYRLSVSGGAEKDGEYWYSNTASLYAGSGSTAEKSVRLAFTREQRASS